MTAVQDTFDDTMHALTGKWLPIDRDSREAVRIAINAAAAEGHGLFTAATVRRYLPPWVVRAQIGNVFNIARVKGLAVNTGRTAANGNRATRNGAKRSPVWRLREPIPPDAVQS